MPNKNKGKKTNPAAAPSTQPKRKSKPLGEPEHPQIGWMRLDNAAKIYPASTRSTWTPMFRISTTFTEPVDVEVLQSALEKTLRRFPGIAVALKAGLFWNYLEPIKEMPKVQPEGFCPCLPMSRKALRKCAVRVLYYENRIAAEYFHSLTDGTGGLIFMKSLAAEYLTQKYHIEIPSEEGVRDRNEPPRPEELEDSFIGNAGSFTDGSRDTVSYRLRGTKEPDGFINLTTGILDAKAAVEKAREYNVSVTTMLTAVMIKAIMELQEKKLGNHKRRYKPVAVQVPVNLRPYFGSDTLRNFALFVTPHVDPRQGEWQLEEIIRTVHHYLGGKLTDKQLVAKFSSNVKQERQVILKVMPLFIKNIALRFSFMYFGESTFTTTISNLGVIKLPEIMYSYVERMNFVLGPQLKNTCNWSANSFGGKLYITSVRSVQEPELERQFFRKLRMLGLHVLIESNWRGN